MRFARLLDPPGRVAMRALSTAVDEMDFEGALAFGRALGSVWFHALRLRRRTVESALGRAFVRWDELRIRETAHRVFRNVAANATTLLWAAAHPDNTARLGRIVRFEGWGHLDLGSGRGAVAACSHTGCWDLVALAAAARGAPLTVLSRNLSFDPMDTTWNEARRRCGVEILDEGASLAHVGERLEGGGIVAVMTDQRPRPAHAGVLVDFLGRPARTSTLAAVAALRWNVPIVAVHSAVDRDGGVRARLSALPAPPGEGRTSERIRAVTAALARDLERWIVLHPDSWLWQHRRWAGAPGHVARSPEASRNSHPRRTWLQDR